MGSQTVWYWQTASFSLISLLTVILVKYMLLDNGYILANIVLVGGLIYIRHLCIPKSERVQEGFSLILFFLFDKELLLNIYNILFLIGIGCIRELRRQDIVFREALSFINGLILMFFGWYSIGRVFAIYSLITLLYLGLGFVFVAFMLLDWFNKSMDYLRSTGRHKIKDITEKKDQAE